MNGAVFMIAKDMGKRKDPFTTPSQEALHKDLWGGMKILDLGIVTLVDLNHEWVNVGFNRIGPNELRTIDL